MKLRTSLSVFIIVVLAGLGFTAFAQSKAGDPKATTVQYATVGIKDKAIAYNQYGDNGASLMSEVDVQTALAQIPKDGWKLHSIVSVVRGTAYEIHKDSPTAATPHTMYAMPATYYMMIVEK